MVDYLLQALLPEALASAQPNATCGDSCAEQLKMLRLEMLSYVLDSVVCCEHLPEYLARPDVKDVFSHLLASEKLLLKHTWEIRLCFEHILWTYYPNSVKTFFDTFTLQIHDDTHRLKFWKTVRFTVERNLCMQLQCNGRMKGHPHLKQEVRGTQKQFCDLIQAMAVPLHDDTVPAIREESNVADYKIEDEHCPLFATAVKLKLAPEALLLLETGAVGNKELGVLAKDPDVQKMLKSEEDNSMLAVLLRKVLNKPRSLEYLAIMQVSRQLWCHAPEDKEKIARGLGLQDIHVERVLLRGQCGQYRAALKRADDED